jgi:hypothetical protein
VTIRHKFSLFNNNLFNKPELFRQLRALGIGGCSTCRKDVTKPVVSNSLETWKLAWGTLWSKIDGHLTRMQIRHLFQHGNEENMCAQ